MLYKRRYVISPSSDSTVVIYIGSIGDIERNESADATPYFTLFRRRWYFRILDDYSFSLKMKLKVKK